MNDRKFVITIDCRAKNWDNVNDYITFLLYRSKSSELAEVFEVTVDNVFVDEDDY